MWQWIHSMRIAETFTSNIYIISKLNTWLPAKAKCWKQLPAWEEEGPGLYSPRSGCRALLRLIETGRKEGSQDGPHSSPVKTTTRPNTTAAKKSAVWRSNKPNAGLHGPFRYRGLNEDEDEKEQSPLEGNLRRTPRGVWVQEAVHRPEPGRTRERESS